ncbi:MAG: hypothetical protein IPK91_12835 [Saprospiraceae bacterium]|jgi:hypothetical protein|nr:hypothetical protein [Saprospiraceae bacterium]MBK8298137.1 hypothetical protein [Saprospiraceae bacterium]
MSKDKGTKNVKKLPADKSSGKGKVLSDYKSEGKGLSKSPVVDAFIPKNDQKSGSKK